MGTKDLLELSDDVVKYVIIEDRLLETLRMQWQYAIWSITLKLLTLYIGLNTR